ncbi:MAG TPA: YbjN domain-containing protein [Armatimonadota bacterium]|nr:YbjN domain-containing protein [Armatimonadota bacterium]
MFTAKKRWSSGVLLLALALGTIGMALHAAEDTTPATPETPEDTLASLLAESEWTSQWVEDGEAHQVIFKGPDVWVRLSGDFVMVQSYLGRIPKDVPNTALLGLLRRNYDLYEGKFAVDQQNDLWFETSTAARLLDTKQLDQQIAVVADAAANASSTIKTETPETLR